jgi:hypothetical protein
MHNSPTIVELWRMIQSTVTGRKEVVILSDMNWVIGQKRILAVWVVAATALIAGIAAPQLSVAQNAVSYDDLQFFIEVNSTDGDAGVQLKLDGEQWKELRMVGPDGSKLLNVGTSQSLETQGLTEFFFESAEPSFKEVPLEEFLNRFPEGQYEFSGTTVEGDHLFGTAELTHVIPEGPTIISPEEGEALDPEKAVIEWEPVTTPEGVEIVSYQVIVQAEDTVRNFDIILPSNATSVTIPEEFFDPDIRRYPFEILAKESGGNQTITESEFEIKINEEDDGEGGDANE